MATKGFSARGERRCNVRATISFPDAGFAGDQNGSRRWSGKFDDAQNILHCFGAADQTSQPSGIAQLTRKRGDLFAVARMAERAIEKRAQHRRLQRLFDIPESSGFDGGDGAIVAAAAGDHNCGNTLQFFGKFVQKGEAVHAGQFDIRNDEARVEIRRIFPALLRRCQRPAGCIPTCAGELRSPRGRSASSSTINMRSGACSFIGHERDPVLFGNLAAAGRQSKARLSFARNNMREMKNPNWTAFNMCTSEIENIAYARRTEYNLAVLRGGIVSLLPPVNTSGDRDIAGVVDLNRLMTQRTQMTRPNGGRSHLIGILGNNLSGGGRMAKWLKVAGIDRSLCGCSRSDGASSECNSEFDGCGKCDREYCAGEPPAPARRQRSIIGILTGDGLQPLGCFSWIRLYRLPSRIQFKRTNV